MAFLGGARIDRFGNLDTTVIGPYDTPKVRCAGLRRHVRDRDHHARRILVIMRQAPRSFVDALDSRTSPGQAAIPPTTPRAAGRGQPYERRHRPGPRTCSRRLGRDDAGDTASRCHRSSMPCEHGVGAKVSPDLGEPATTEDELRLIRGSSTRAARTPNRRAPHEGGADAQAARARGALVQARPASPTNRPGRPARHRERGERLRDMFAAFEATTTGAAARLSGRRTASGGSCDEPVLARVLNRTLPPRSRPRACGSPMPTAVGTWTDAARSW